MIEAIISFSARNKFLVIFTFALIAVAGYLRMQQTPVDAIPDLSENQVIVFTDWMGRSPQEIEDQITYPLSVNLQGLAGVKTVRSSSEFNFSMINVIFDDSVDFYFARDRVLERLALAKTYLPAGVTPYMAPDSTALGQIFWYTVEGDDKNLDELRSIQDWQVRYQLNAVPGVAQVASVGGMPREYQIDVLPERLRAYDISLGQLYDAVARSNSAVGGSVVQKGKAEYLIRSVGWIGSLRPGQNASPQQLTQNALEDIRNTVVTARAGVPIRVGDVAVVQLGPEFRRSALEKDGRDVVGGVVMMRYGENPRKVTAAVKQKIAELQDGLDPGVRIVPFYDRTRLIDSAIETVDTVLLHEILIAAIAILLIMSHFRSVIVVVVTLPLAILIAFLMMWLFGISSNIMSLSGIAISIGILVDQSIVMLENSTHHLSAHFGDKPITGDTTEIVAKACRQVGRPIFFSVLIMVLSFLPVFALTGQGGKMFHPLAFTKTFALIGVAMIAITLVPAIIPLLVRGKLRKEEDNWIVRSVAAMYRPVLRWLMQRPYWVGYLFFLLCAVGVYLAFHTGSEFMPKLDEGSIMDMPVTSPRASITEVVDDLKTRDSMLREFPEVERAVGKVGRADTPTDPSPLEMVETIVTLRPREHWLKRKMKPDDARAEARRQTAAWESTGLIKPFATARARQEFSDHAAERALVEFDRRMRHELVNRQLKYDDDLAARSVEQIGLALLTQITDRDNWAQEPTAAERTSFLAASVDRYKPMLRSHYLPADVKAILTGGLALLQEQHRLKPELVDPWGVSANSWAAVVRSSRSALSMANPDFFQHTVDATVAWRFADTTQWAGNTNQAVYDLAMVQFEQALWAQMEAAARQDQQWLHADQTVATAPLLDQIAPAAKLFGGRTFLWQKEKKDIVAEMDTGIQQIGWVNIWTQPIDNRINMLATGVRTEIGVKVISSTKDLQTLQDLSDKVRNILQTVPGAVDVQADQVVGKGYVEINVDRDRAARYGVNVGDIQESIEVALGGKMITTTVEGRQRFPVRVRYARDYRDDEESIKRILISLGGSSAGDGGGMGGGAAGGMAGAAPVSVSTAAPGSNGLAAIYLGDVADVKVVEGPKMIASENGYLRSYVTCNVRGRDAVGFQQEAATTIASRVKLPSGFHLEWTGEFEHQRETGERMLIVFPVVLVLIFVILYLTYRDLLHAVLMMLAIPGALAGGMIFQYVGGYPFSTAVGVGFIACFGMATETGIIMLVYLREAIERRGGLANIATLKDLEDAIMEGAVHRLRPKLLTEGTAIIGLAPMLFERGTGSEIMQPMAAPVLGGLLVADEVIDIFLPVLFYQVEAMRWRKLHPATAPNKITESTVTEGVLS